MTKEQLIAFLKKNNLSPNFTYGQNFLIDDFVLQDIVDAAEVGRNDVVLEIGPGIGNLTRLLCDRSGFVLSVEKDPKFLPILKLIKKKYKNNFQYEVDDILRFNFQDVFIRRKRSRKIIESSHFSPSAFGCYKVVANIPYYITGKILQLLLTAKHKPSSITVLMQKEVARSAAAKEGNMNVLALSVQLYGEAKIIQTVPAGSFFPAPKVDSAILHIKLYDKQKYNIADEKKFFSLIKACFAGKRKQLHNSLANFLQISKYDATEILNEAGLSPAVRPQELSIESWVRLLGKIHGKS